MPRCRSWRPDGKSTHPVGHTPGKCRTCWRPCLAHVESGQIRCESCVTALADHHDPRVRLSLLDESPPSDVIELLCTDLDPLVARTAAFRLQAALEGTSTW